MKKSEKSLLLNYANRKKADYTNVIDLSNQVRSYAMDMDIQASNSDVNRICKTVLSNECTVTATELSVITAKQLAESNLPKLKYCVDEILPHGVAILTAKSKMYKSWMAMQACLCVSQGLPFLGFKTHKSDVLYIDLENDLRLTKERLSLMLGDKSPPDNFYIVNEVPTMEQGFTATMEEFISNYPKVKLIVIDIFAKIKYPKKSNQSDYDADYKSISELKNLATKHDLAILLIAHNRKMVDASDPFTNILGSTALMGATDEAIVIYKTNRSDKEFTISVTGRTVQSADFKATFDDEEFQWKLLGNLDEYEALLEEMRYNDNPVVYTIKKLLEESPNNCWSGRLDKLIENSRSYGKLICKSSQSIGREMTKLKSQLYRYDGIEVKTISNGTGSKKYEFSKLCKK